MAIWRVIFLFLLAVPAYAAEPALVGGLTPGEALSAGERMYREGLLPSGEPMQAIVQGDIPVEGTMFTCDDCHLRSGLGAAEGTVVSLPTNGAKLYRTLNVGAEIETRPSRAALPPTFQGGIIRPPYTDETLAQVIWNGVDPAGREISWTMPRYLLEPGEMEILVDYLKNLSAEFSPGVNDSEIRYATVVSADVPAADRAAMLQTLEAVVRDRNAQSRHQEARARKGPFYKQDKYTAYRRTVLDVWELKGPRETWSEQLEAFYRQQPVFALIGGIVPGDWSPVHRFCESNQIPCIFPITEMPVVAENDWYTLYFSKGYFQEGEAAARYLSGRDKNRPVVQVAADTPESRLAAEGFRTTFQLLGGSLAADHTLRPEELAGDGFWNDLRQNHPGAAIVLWLDAEGMPVLQALAGEQRENQPIVVSWSLMGESLYSLPEEVRPMAFIAYPYRLPTQLAAHEKTVKAWLKVRNIPETNTGIQSKIYFLGWMLTGVTRMMGDDFYRDYFLDSFDMMQDENYAIAAYPRVSFGPGQRYGSKGCFIVQLSAGAKPNLVPVSDWVIH